MRKLFLIPARGGSKGIPQKNIRPLQGKPLIQYSIEAAIQSMEDGDHICVSTDSPEIAQIVENLGVKIPFLRPAELASDTASTHEVILHALEFYRSTGESFDVVVLLQPTSPLRTSNHITSALRLFSDGVDAVVSVKETKCNPYFNLFEEDSNGYLTKSKTGNFQRRQDSPDVWELNGAIYIFDPEKIKTCPLLSLPRIVKFVMKEEDSVDIDSEIDWIVTTQIMKRHEQSN